MDIRTSNKSGDSGIAAILDLELGTYNEAVVKLLETEWLNITLNRDNYHPKEEEFPQEDESIELDDSPTSKKSETDVSNDKREESNSSLLATISLNSDLTEVDHALRIFHLNDTGSGDDTDTPELTPVKKSTTIRYINKKRRKPKSKKNICKEIISSKFSKPKTINSKSNIGVSKKEYISDKEDEMILILSRQLQDEKMKSEYFRKSLDEMRANVDALISERSKYFKSGAPFSPAATTYHRDNLNKEKIDQQQQNDGHDSVEKFMNSTKQDKEYANMKDVRSNNRILELIALNEELVKSNKLLVETISKLRAEKDKNKLNNRPPFTTNFALADTGGKTTHIFAPEQNLYSPYAVGAEQQLQQQQHYYYRQKQPNIRNVNATSKITKNQHRPIYYALYASLLQSKDDYSQRNKGSDDFLQRVNCERSNNTVILPPASIWQGEELSVPFASIPNDVLSLNSSNTSIKAKNKSSGNKKFQHRGRKLLI